MAMWLVQIPFRRGDAMSGSSGWREYLQRAAAPELAATNALQIGGEDYNSALAVRVYPVDDTPIEFFAEEVRWELTRKPVDEH